MDKLIRIVSVIIILLGLVHTCFAYPFDLDTYTLWFLGAGMAIIFSGLLNLVAIQNGGTRFSIIVGIVVNALNCALFCWALRILNQPQVYVGITVCLLSTVAFALKYRKAQLGREIHA